MTDTEEVIAPAVRRNLSLANAFCGAGGAWAVASLVPVVETRNVMQLAGLCLTAAVTTGAVSYRWMPALGRLAAGPEVLATTFMASFLGMAASLLVTGLVFILLAVVTALSELPRTDSLTQVPGLMLAGLFIPFLVAYASYGLSLLIGVCVATGDLLVLWVVAGPTEKAR